MKLQLLVAACLCISLHRVLASDCGVPAGSPLATQTIALTQAQIEEILLRHDEAKLNVPFPVDDMELYEWDPILANQAMAYAKICQWAHTPQCYRQNVGQYWYVGENLASGSDPTYTPANGGIEHMIDNWLSELADYDWIGNKCNPGRMCGHYTQAVWHNSNRIGCAVVLCPKGTILGASFAAWYLICHYAPGGNMGGEKPGHQVAPGNPCYDHVKTCGKHGSCLASGSGAYTCQCEHGYKSVNNGPCTGGQGGTPPPNPCATERCNAHGSCTPDSNADGFTCTCNSGYSGKYCDQVVVSNPCTNNPCNNGGTCAPDPANKQSPKCTCTGGYSGPTCNVAPVNDPCKSNQCKNGATCVPTANKSTYTCTCKTGWKGTLCDQKSTTGGTPPPTNDSPPAGFLTALFNSLNADRSGIPKLVWKNILMNAAKSRSGTCPQAEDVDEADLMVCLDSKGVQFPNEWADVLKSWWSYSPWWTQSNVLSVGCEYNSNCPDLCGTGSPGAATAIVVCKYAFKTNPQIMVPFTSPIDYGNVQLNREPLYFRQKSRVSYLLVGAIAAVASVLVAGIAIQVRRRRIAAAELSYNLVENDTL